MILFFGIDERGVERILFITPNPASTSPSQMNERAWVRLLGEGPLSLCFHLLQETVHKFLRLVGRCPMKLNFA